MQKGRSHVSKTLQAGVATAALAAMLLAAQQPGFADVDSLKGEQSQKQQELEEARQKEQAAKAQKEQFQQQINVNAEDINKLTEQIDQKENEIAKLQSSIYAKQQELDATQTELEAAEQRVKERDILLKQRLRLMYEQGDVQYMEVLLNSTSFSDFLDRFDSLQAIFKQDTRILEENKKDRDTIAAKKKQLEDQKTQLTAMKADQVDQKAALDTLKGQKEAINRQLEANKDEAERVEHEQQKIQDDAVAAIYQLTQQIEAEQHKANTSAPAGETFSGPFTWPLPGQYTITSEFGDRIDPFTGERAGHNGMDIAAPQGTTIVAAQSGTVITSGWVSGFGNCIIINHGGGLWSLYGHIMNGGLLVSVGQQVTKGEPIGKVGTTGRSTGPHLHLGVYENGVLANPRKYL